MHSEEFNLYFARYIYGIVKLLLRLKGNGSSYKFLSMSTAKAVI